MEVISIIGLEYILALYDMQHIDLAERLGIKKQNINMWIKGKQKIPKKYLPVLEELFGINVDYFNKNIDEYLTKVKNNIGGKNLGENKK